ncbi:MAG: transporter substrate-binding domain-containing protein [Actinobacteria bacterium]|nr:transporter substrate-binding domain-containing protein [Actinomycetota bacterium]MCI0542997.1 transporter substrate-binding domain-containing protein [Actinomycetota bacterium]MCI0678660.1 transporter substrate-binding domain-containing protein [Actinomycetota bacterium]
MKNRMTLIAVISALTLVAAACSPAEPAATTEPAPATTQPAPDTTEAPPTTEAPGTTTGETALPDLGGRTVTVGVENAYIPFNYIPIGADAPEGWDYDAWAYICELLNCVPEFVESAWPAVIDIVAAGDLDTAADGISITDDRKEIVDYSDPYMVVTQKLISQLEDERTTAQEIIDDPAAVIATQVGTTNFELAVSLVGEDRVQAFDQFGLAIQALIAGDVDAVIIDDAAGLGYIGENAEVLKTLEGDLQSDPLGFIFPKGSDLVDPVNQAIQVMFDDGTMTELGVKYFGPDFDIGYEDIEEVGG